jgi:CDP-diacylglycerol--glycerol-3-phosphate 3-phosphatidyltransferase
VLTAALIATLLKVNRVLRYALWVYLGLTMIATLYFGWHYVADDLAGIAIGLIAVPVAGVATGHIKPEIPVRWRPMVPNALTLGRIAVVPLVVWLLLWEGGESALAAVLFASASLTDACDGFLARRWNVQSSFGTLLDPFADKLLVLGSLGALASVDRVPWWIVGIVAAREVWVTLLRAQARRGGVVVAAGPLGKLKMCVQVGTLLILMTFDVSGASLDLLLGAMAAITIGSGVEVAQRAHRDTAPLAAPAT